MVSDGVTKAIRNAVLRGIGLFGSQDRLAEASGLHRNTISRWSRGDLKEPELIKIIRLFEVTDSDLNDLKTKAEPAPAASPELRLLEEIRSGLITLLDEKRSAAPGEKETNSAQNKGAFSLPKLSEWISSFEERSGVSDADTARRGGQGADGLQT